MSGIYTAVFNNVAVTAIQDLFELVAPATAIVVLHDIHISQNTDVSDAAEEILRLELTSGHTTSGSGGSSVTPVSVLPGQPAFGGTCEANNTTQASAGTIVTHCVWNWNIRVGFDKVWTPETRPILAPSRRMCLELPAAPADSITVSGTLTFEEIG
ncbi:MAG: hypothetical protein MUC79_08930 [Thiobacillaceae bacterium]|jgi:hypothetical protein|nr:hypothetical protein [Thiobacillaceae bacterium]